MLVHDSSANTAFIATLQPQIPAIKLDKLHRERKYKGTKVGTNVRENNRWYGNIKVGDDTFLIGPYETEEEAGTAYATAKHHLVDLRKRSQIDEDTQALLEEVPAEAHHQDKYSNVRFHADGRKHHDKDDKYSLGDNLYFSDDDKDAILNDIKTEIEKCEDEVQRRLLATAAAKSKSVPCADVLADVDSKICTFFAESVKTKQQLIDLVDGVMKEAGEDKGLDFFYNPENIEEENAFPSERKYYDHMAGIRDRVGRRMVIYLGRSCHYCGRAVNPDHADKWWAWTTEHLRTLGKKSFLTSKMGTLSAVKQIVELRKTVPACRCCNPTGETGDEQRNWFVDYFYARQILTARIDLGERREVKDILNSTEFKDFYEEGERMNLTYTGKVDEDGNKINGRTGRSATFLELKLLLWKHYRILLDDIVTWRKISDVRCPRYAFHFVILTLIKNLCNRCKGTADFDYKCTGWYNLRNLSAWQYAGIHYDHNGGDGTHSKEYEVSDMCTWSWEKLRAELIKCAVLCAECHKCD